MQNTYLMCSLGFNQPPTISKGDVRKVTPCVRNRIWKNDRFSHGTHVPISPGISSAFPKTQLSIIRALELPTTLPRLTLERKVEKSQNLFVRISD